MSGGNVLITSAGRRTSLLKAFKEATRRCGGKVLAGDIDGLAPALYMADQVFRLPPIRSADYIPSLLDIVRGHKVRLLVPTLDSELPNLARSASAFSEEGCQALISAPQLVAITQDKWETVRFFTKNGIRLPQTWLPHQASLHSLPKRLVVKPRHGSASKNVYHVDRSELEWVLRRIPDPILQEEVRYPEITIDALLDLEGKPVHYVPRLRIKTMSGESIQGATIPDEGIRHWVLKVLEVLSAMGGRGPMTLQAFLTNGEVLLSEVNPRFGGGFPLTQAAGGDYADWILRMLANERVSPRFGAYKRHLYMTRYHEEHFVEVPLWA